MIPQLSREQVREVDRRAIEDYGMSGLMLMENAGRGTADVLCAILSQQERAGHVLIVCGRGNNGGDGFVIARQLDLRGIDVRVTVLVDPGELRGDAAANYKIIELARLLIKVFSKSIDRDKFETQVRGAAWLVDAILGTGASGEPKSPYSEAIDLMNASGIPILAVDLPSGLDCDTGVPARHTIRATHTCTFVAAKPGFFNSAAADYVGQLHVVDIGVPRRLLDEMTSKSQVVRSNATTQ
jgi:NAD(P)H-hydrate epimerase